MSFASAFPNILSKKEKEKIKGRKKKRKKKKRKKKKAGKKEEEKKTETLRSCLKKGDRFLLQHHALRSSQTTADNFEGGNPIGSNFVFAGTSK